MTGIYVLVFVMSGACTVYVRAPPAGLVRGDGEIEQNLCSDKPCAPHNFPDRTLLARPCVVLHHV